MGYLGLTPTTAQQNYLNIDDISGSFNGTTTSFALQVGGVAPTPFPVTNSCLISVGGVVQQPDETGTDGFRISGGNIIFSSAPGTGEDFFGLVLAGADYLNVGANFPDGTVGNPSITFDSDLNTGIYHPSADSIAITSGGTAALTIDSNRRLGIGTASPVTTLEVQNSTDPKIRIGDGIRHFEVHGGSATQNTGIGTDYNSGFNFFVNGENNVAATIDSSGRLLVNTSSALSVLTSSIDLAGSGTSTAQPIINIAHFANAANATSRPILNFYRTRGTQATPTANSSGDLLAQINFNAYDGNSTDSYTAGKIECVADAAHGVTDTPGRLVFSTCADGASTPTERMRISSTGRVGVKSDTSGAGESFQVGEAAAGYCIATTVSSTASRFHHRFINGNGVVGSITTNGSATAFNTSSDYRLKENVVPLTGAADRLNQLQVHRFNFIADPDTTVDGFIAHEAQAVVPECVTGTKDEVDDEGNPVYQGIDQSKLVPLLTAALQEALAKIETLEQRLSDAGIA